LNRIWPFSSPVLVFVTISEAVRQWWFERSWTISQLILRYVQFGFNCVLWAAERPNKRIQWIRWFWLNAICSLDNYLDTARSYLNTTICFLYLKRHLNVDTFGKLYLLQHRLSTKSGKGDWTVYAETLHSAGRDEGMTQLVTSVGKRSKHVQPAPLETRDSVERWRTCCRNRLAAAAPLVSGQVV